jgi:hypothetical protein
MKNNFSGNEIKFKAPLYPFIIKNNQLPLVDVGIKLNELQLNKKLRKNSKNKNLKKSNSFSSNSKTKYNNFINDKESLYEINKHLKSELNEVKKELIKIKNENIKKDNEINQRENLINNTFEIKEEEYLKEETKIQNEISDKCLHSNLIYKLKKQYNDLKKEFDNKDNDVYLLKKNIKNSRLNELIVENSVILQELNKLKSLYNHQINENNNLNIKKKTVKEIETNISKQHFIIMNLQENLTKSNEENSNLKNENSSLKSKYKRILNEHKENNEKVHKMEEQIRNLLLEKKELEDKNYLLTSQININLQKDNIKNKISSFKSDSSINGAKNAQITEITYILIKNFEARKITKDEALNKIFKTVIDNLYGESQVEKSGLVVNFTDKICEVIQINNNEIDRNKIYYLIESLLTTSNNELGKFMENFLQLIDSIKYYDLNDEKRLNDKIRNSLGQYKDYFIQNYKKDCISFFSFRALLNKQNIMLDDESVEYLIYRMKKDCKTNNNSNQSIFDLYFKTVTNIINNIEETDDLNENKENQNNNDIENNKQINNNTTEQKNNNNKNKNKPMENNYINTPIDDNLNQNEIIPEENIKENKSHEDNLNKNSNINENENNLLTDNFIIEENTNEIQDINSPKTELQEIQNDNLKSNEDRSDILQVSIEKIEDDIENF